MVKISASQGIKIAVVDRDIVENKMTPAQIKKSGGTSSRVCDNELQGLLI